MSEQTTVHVVFPDGRVVTSDFPVWLLPLPGDVVTVPEELGADGGMVPLTVNARLLQPKLVDGKPRVTLFVESALQPPERPHLTVVQ